MQFFVLTLYIYLEDSRNILIQRRSTRRRA